MLTPAYLAGCADQVAAMFSQLEADITADVAARVAKMGKYSESSQWQAQKLREAKAAYDMCQRMLKTCRKSASKEIQEVLLNGCREAMRADDSIYRAAGMHSYSISSSEALMDIILAGLAKTNGVMDNLTMTTARDASHSIQNALDRAYMQVMSGAYSYDQAAARVIRDLGSKGYTCFKYDSGTRTSLEAATRRALLTGLNQTTAELQLHRATDLGTELVEVSSHAGARPTHAVWQGEIYSLHGDTGKYRDFYRETEYGDGDGLCGWNCYHNFYPYVEGVSSPTFEKDPARRLGKTNDELYEETQQQRYYERQVRKSRRQCSTLSAAMDEADDLLRERLRPEFTKASVLLKRREAALRAFCEKTGLPYDASRVTTFSFGRSTSAKAVWANRKAQMGLKNSSNRGTILTKPIVDGSTTVPMNRARYEKMKSGLAKNGCIVISAKDDDFRYLQSLGAEATYSHGYIMHMGETPSASAMFEETIHFTQSKKYGEVDSTDFIERAAREVAANRKLLKHSKAYGFTETDRNEITINLKNWEKDFERRVGLPYDKAEEYHRDI